MIVLIREPGSLASIQVGLQGTPNIYLMAQTRVSRFENNTSVLDVRLPIVAPNKWGSSPYRVLEGHTRCYTAAVREVGIEAYFAQTIADLDMAPEECFMTLNKGQCLEVFKELDYYQTYARGYGTYFVRDLL